MNLLEGCIVFYKVGHYPYLKSAELAGFNERGQAFITNGNNAYNYEFILDKHAGASLTRALKIMVDQKEAALAKVDAEYEQKLSILLEDFPTVTKRKRKE